MKAIDADMMTYNGENANDSPDVSCKGGKNNLTVCYSFDVSQPLVGPVLSKVKYYVFSFGCYHKQFTLLRCCQSRNMKLSCHFPMKIRNRLLS